MRLPHHPEALAALRRPSPEAPWRVLVSGCLAAWPCGVDGTTNGTWPDIASFLALPTVRALPFCPEAHTLGVPRPVPDLHGGDGLAALDGRARVLSPEGEDLTAPMIEGARAMLDRARDAGAEWALLMDMSAACGSQVISLGARSAPQRRYQRGVGVATALLLRAGLPVVSQRDHKTLAALRALADPAFTAPEGLLDHHEHPWVIAHLPA